MDLDTLRALGQNLAIPEAFSRHMGSKAIQEKVMWHLQQQAQNAQESREKLLSVSWV